MELLVSVIIVFIVTFAIFGIVNMLKQINNLPNEQEIDKRIPPCVGHAYSNTIKCECCQSVIDLDDTDWCDKCNRSIFDDSPCKPTEKTNDFMYNWIREKSGKK